MLDASLRGGLGHVGGARRRLVATGSQASLSQYDAQLFVMET